MEMVLPLRNFRRIKNAIKVINANEAATAATMLPILLPFCLAPVTTKTMCQNFNGSIPQLAILRL